ncbi:WHI2-like protein [Elsinoe australis]|uniref:WHI2-like protein n=1 Tax=Elsinoe australis TaxID=40998 RepID=A0A2P7YEE1_9PEZI|nr:WHI2-like protein [Elsinoe australis]
MALSSESLAGPGYIILNGIRVLNIIGLLAVIAASVVMLIKTTTDSAYFFFDACTDVVVAFSSTFLLLSELNLFKNYFARNMPLLSPSHGFVTLSLAMLILGTGLLGKLNHDSNSPQHLGLAFWRIVISAGILIFILGFINLVASFLFRDRKSGITARQVRAHGAVASHMTPPLSAKASFTSPKSELRTPATPDRASPTVNRNNPLRLITSPLQVIHDRLDGGNRVQPDPVLPSYHASMLSPPSTRQNHHDEAPSPTSRYSRATLCFKKGGFHPFGKKRESSLAPPLPISISAPLNQNPQFAHLARPDSALHPARGNEREVRRW